MPRHTVRVSEVFPKVIQGGEADSGAMREDQQSGTGCLGEYWGNKENSFMGLGVDGGACG